MTDESNTIDQTKGQKTSAVSFSPALYVFLGSSPAEIGWRIKKLQDSAYGDLPIFQYIWVDTDTRTNPDVAAWLESENVTRANIGSVSGAEILRRLDEYPSIKAWWPKKAKIRSGTFDRGANQVRIHGRFAYFALFNRNQGKNATIKDSLESAADRVIGIDQAQAVPRLAKNGLTYTVDNSQVRIFIIDSICGGTGSGIVFDVAYLLRNYFVRNDVNHQMIGVQILPPVIDKAIRGMDQGQRLKIKANGYSHLQDLDYLNETQNWKVSYPGINLDLSRPVFDYTYLIDIVNKSGKALNDEQDVYKMISQAIFMISITPIAQELASHQDNTSALRTLLRGKPAFASSFASASLVLPKERILDYCSARLTTDSIRSICQNHYESSSERPEHLALIEALGLQPDKLFQSLHQNQFVINNQLAFIQNAKNPGEALSIISSEQSNDESERREIIIGFAERKRNTTDLLKAKLKSKTLEYLKQFGPDYTSGLLASFLNDRKISLTRFQSDLDKVKANSLSSADALKEVNDAKKSLESLTKQFGSQITQWLIPKKWKDDLERDKTAVIDAMAKYNTAELSEKLSGLVKQIYVDLTEEVKDIRSTLDSFSDLLNEAKGELDLSIPGLIKPESDAQLFSLSKEVVDDDYFPDFYANHISTLNPSTVFTDFINQQANVSLASLQLFKKNEIKSAMLKIAQSRFFSALDNINFLQEINRHYGADATKVLEKKIDEVLEYCSPFWRYRVGGENHNPMRPSYLGIEDSNTPLLPKKYRSDKGINLVVTSTGIKDAIYFTVVEHGVPLWLLSELSVWKSAYDDFLRTSDGSDPLNIIAEAAQNELDPEDSKSVAEMFALALVFGYIAKRGNRFYFDSEKLYQDPQVVADQSHLIAIGREKAANAFAGNSEWTNKARLKIVDEIGDMGVKNAILIITKYHDNLVNEKNKLPVKNSIRPQLEKEIEILEKIIARLSDKGVF